jgi:hypothetical protein
VNERRTTSQALPGVFGLENAPMLTTRLLNKSAMAVTEIRGLLHITASASVA